MIHRHRLGTIRAVSATIGVAGALVLLVALAPQARPVRASASVSFSVPLNGELAVMPAAPRPALSARSLMPGGAPSEASFSVRNQTGKALTVGFLAKPDSSALDGLLMLRLTAAGRTFSETTLQGLRHRGVAKLRLASGQSRLVRLQVWIPPEITTGYEGQQVAVSLDPSVAGAHP